MRLLLLFLVRFLLWFGLPLALVVLAVGPKRCWSWVKQGWNWLWSRREEPEVILTRVVKQHQEHVAAVRKALAQNEVAEAEIGRNLETSQANVVALEEEAKTSTARGDDLGARAALYKLNLEKAAVESFSGQRQRQRQTIADTRRRLYQLELQLRQFEVGRSVLLGQLAEAKTVEQQYAIANQFDPFSAVANWQRAEGMVEEQAITARAAERVHKDTADLHLGEHGVSTDPAVLDGQLAELKRQLEKLQPQTKAPADNEELRRKRVPEG